LVPSERVIVVSMLAVAPPDAVGAALVVNGGQNVAHAPVHEDFVAVSEANMYSDLPEASVRNVPWGPLWVSTDTALVAPAGADVLGVPDELDEPPLDLAELLHAAASTAAATTALPSDSTRSGRTPIVIISFVIWGPRGGSPHQMTSL
jgi:hypothetical protein